MSNDWKLFIFFATLLISIGAVLDFFLKDDELYKLRLSLRKFSNSLSYKPLEEWASLIAQRTRTYISTYFTTLEDGVTIGENFLVKANQTVLITSGIHIKLPDIIELPDGNLKMIEAQMRGRSGMSLKYDTNVKLGTIDPTYMGDCGVIFKNESSQPQYFKKDDAVAQLVFNEVIKFPEENY